MAHNRRKKSGNILCVFGNAENVPQQPTTRGEKTIQKKRGIVQGMLTIYYGINGSNYDIWMLGRQGQSRYSGHRRPTRPANPLAMEGLVRSPRISL